MAKKKIAKLLDELNDLYYHMMLKKKGFSRHLYEILKEKYDKKRKKFLNEI